MKVITSFLIAMFFMGTMYSQVADTLKTKVFSFTPVSKYTGKVNGLTFGVGHELNRGSQSVTVNGLNLEVNPLTPFIVLMVEPRKSMIKYSVPTTVNGVHIAVGGFLGGGIINGLNLSVFNAGRITNGLSITAFYNYTYEMNGLHIAGISNTTDKASGVLLSFGNSADDFKGLQVGAINMARNSMVGLQLGGYNEAGNMTGIQIGIFNKAKKVKGFQLGLWNVNEKRSLPIINF
ncbi:hypothetical protein GCM10007424_08650 [Flavobacterium suaedae]|uniref:Uncharacterized protein n=1 Tax=Flavobacterium suaedae TaxID=1767027 RepID=A0ABQ1JN80_9FLAO|nr:hypothetical protein [Flavobacterium suaedae]GGB70928.1 hypothetical protein GCM10007424_08650 [Flavobacterium suaedae]